MSFPKLYLTMKNCVWCILDTIMIGSCGTCGRVREYEDRKQEDPLHVSLSAQNTAFTPQLMPSFESYEIKQAAMRMFSWSFCHVISEALGGTLGVLWPIALIWPHSIPYLMVCSLFLFPVFIFFKFPIETKSNGNLYRSMSRSKKEYYLLLFYGLLRFGWCCWN